MEGREQGENSEKTEIDATIETAIPKKAFSYQIDCIYRWKDTNYPQCNRVEQSSVSRIRR